MRSSDWSADVCSSDLKVARLHNILDDGFGELVHASCSIGFEKVDDLSARTGLDDEIDGFDRRERGGDARTAPTDEPGCDLARGKIGRASCRERVCADGESGVVAAS